MTPANDSQLMGIVLSFSFLSQIYDHSLTFQIILFRLIFITESSAFSLNRLCCTSQRTLLKIIPKFCSL